MQRHTGHLLKSLCFISVTFLLLHIIYQTCLNSLLAGNSLDPNFNCSTWEKTFRQLGLESVRGADVGNGIRVFVPDAGVCVASLVAWLLCRTLLLEKVDESLPPPRRPDLETEEQVSSRKCEELLLRFRLRDVQPQEGTKMRILRRVAGVASELKEIVGNLITTAGKVVVTILLGLTGITLPSLTSAVYFLLFLGLCTWWSLCRTFEPLVFSCLCVLMAIFSAGHLAVLYLYQLQTFQELISPTDKYISLFGISSIIQHDCSQTWKFIVNPNLEWFYFANPIMLLVLYYTLATLIRLWLQEPVDPVTSGAQRSPAGEGHCERDSLGNRNVWSLRVTAAAVVPSAGGRESEEERGATVSSAVAAFRFIMKQSYICALIAMMAWSITYVSWLTFVFLIWSCTLWMVRDRRKYAMLTSPFMVLYGNLLIVLQYVWSFEVLQGVPGLFLKKEVPFRELGSKVLCLLTFWLLLRQALMERREKLQEDVGRSGARLTAVPSLPEDKSDGAAGDKEVVHVLGNIVMSMFAKYWIYVCGGMFFFVSFEGRIVIYKIIYMMLFLFCVALYQVHYEWWRRILKYFWMSVVVYTMLVLILVYTFQFDSSLHVWSNMTGLSKQKLEDLGLEKFSVPVLFTRIFIPTSFLLVCILHLHYFHERFLQLTDLSAMAAKQESAVYRLAHLDGSLPDISMMKSSSGESVSVEGGRGAEEPTEPDGKAQGQLRAEDPESPADHTSDLKNKWHLVMDRITVLFLKFLECFHKMQLFIWWLLELHIIKIVSSYIIWVSVKEVSLFNYVFLVSWAFALPFSQFRPLASSVCTVWTCVIIVCKMLYQLTSIQPALYSKNCSMPLNYTDAQRSEMQTSVLYSSPVDPAHWVGLRKFSPVLENLRNNLLMLALLAFEVTVYRHQQFYRLKSNLTVPVTKTIFHDITRHHLDDGIVNCAKYFINYFFYKFGLETCFLLAVNVIGQRMDFYAMLHAFCLIAVMQRRRRKAIADVWPKYCCFLACMLTFQYFVCIGIPPVACTDYPWRFPSSTVDSNVIKWLYFPDFHTKPNPLFLLYDFMLLLSASLQRRVFEDENQEAVAAVAGDNVEICRDLDAASFSQHNPVPDFIYCRSYLDMLKVIIFSYLFWFVLTIIFITGTTRISIFCMGYLVACFYFLLFGGNLLLKPIKSILHFWDFLIAYNVFVITMKNILSIVACGYIKALVANSCWLIQLFSLACTIKGYSRPEPNKQCELPSDEAGIIWDSICFAFLLLQRRVFMSYYFLHVVADIRSSQVLASRGAELFQATIVKAVKARIEQEKKSMDQLKRQMDRIKTRQQKFKKGKERMMSLAQESVEGLAAKREEDGDEAAADKGRIQSRRKQWWRPWVDHASMVRSGDYYLFETDSEEEEEEEERKEEEPPKKSAFQVRYKRRGSSSLWDKTALAQCRSANIMHMVKFVPHLSPIDNIIRRVFNIMKFSWILFLAVLESFTNWLNSMCREYIDISTVLRTERCMLTRQIKKGHVPSRESIHIYYQQQMRMNLSRESGLDGTTEDYSMSSVQPVEYGQTELGVQSLDSAASRESLSSEPTQRQGTAGTIHKMEDEREHVHTSRVEADSGRRDSTVLELAQDECCVCSGVDVGQDSLHPLELRLSTPDMGSCSGAEPPPSYSKAVSFDRVSICSDDRVDGPLSSLTHELTASELLRNRMFHDEELEASERFYQEQPPVLQLAYALYNMLVAHSEMVCYLVIVVNHMISASVATLVLPILIFLWAMLSVPRPSKRFWMTAIVYTEVTIVIKYFFQFGFFPFNQNIELDKTKPFHPPNIIGVEKKDGYVHYDLVQLLALFFHRSILKVLKEAPGSSAVSAEGVRGTDAADGVDKVRSVRVCVCTENGAFTAWCTAVHERRVFRCVFPAGVASVSSRSSSTSSRRAAGVHGATRRSRRELLLDKLMEQLARAKAFTVRQTLEIYTPIRQFFYSLIHPEYSAVTDVYVLMFLADTVDFIIIVFGFWAFGKHSAAADITSSLSEDQVPEAFLVMVLIQFGTMVVDRALYLRKTVMGKVIFQVILVFGIHFWMFFILPGVTERRFSLNTVAQLWYFVKCIYFGLSAYQIRCGYPTRVLGNFLTKSYNYVNLFLFQGFRLVPFLTELRAVMDWVWTDTTLSLSSWICVEDIYAHVFVLKCWRESEKRYPQPRGQKKKKVVKYGMGGMIVMLLICIVWFPLLFMSLVKSVAGVVNKPLDVSVKITLGGFQPIFTMSAQQNQLKDISDGAMQFLEAYTSDDVTVAELEGSSNSLWTISPPSRRNLMEVLSKEDQFPVTMTWSIQRNLSLGAKAELASDKHVSHLDTKTRQELIELLNGTRREAVLITNVFPCFIRAPSDSNAKPVDQLYDDNGYKNITLALERNRNGTGEVQEWWIVDQPSSEKLSVRKQDKKKEAGLELYVFSDKVSPPSLGFLAGYGIMGLYASVVLVIGKFVREFFSGISHSIMFEELPCVDRILKLCTDIFLVRETGELELEEDLYAKLIFLYRSPETMIKWTREKTK
uniref:Piezo-type mechanosensitive ion channel component 2a, tandem duplicate 2 n=1 Tax=Scleropages formosus TaxID=113540 RepID=A0A8C9RRS0_SCLFO